MVAAAAFVAEPLRRDAARRPRAVPRSPAAVLVLAHLVLRWDVIARAVGARQLRYGGNTALLVLVVLGDPGRA